jgi:hypothetical protein
MFNTGNTSKLAAPTRRRLLRGALGLAAACTTIGTPRLGDAQPALRTLSPTAALGERWTGSMFSVNSLSLAPDGKTMLTNLRSNSEATLWDLSTQEPTKYLKSEDFIVTAHFVANGKRSIIVSQNNKAQLWDLADARVISTKVLDGDKIEAASLAPDERHVAIGQEERLSVWDLHNGTRVAARNEPDLGLLGRLAFAPNGKWLASVYRDEVRAYDAASLQLLAKWQVEFANGGLACSHDSRRILFGDGEQVRIFDIATKREAGRIRQFGPERSFFLGMAALRDDLFATGDSYGHFLIGSSRAQPRFIAKSADPPIKATRVAISRDQKFAYVGTEEGQVMVFDLSKVKVD